MRLKQLFFEISLEFQKTDTKNCFTIKVKINFYNFKDLLTQYLVNK
jgi:hypothetical protein